MNERVWIAQADTTAAQNPTPLKVVTVVKPGSEQAITIDLGFDQKTKVDLSAVANEKMTMVHVGTKLIVLFDNHSTVTIEPFFDSTGKPLANLDVNLGTGHDVTGDQFASLFPITEDQSVLPAAGGGGSPASGADFHSPTVDPLGVGTPLPLLGPESLGNFQTIAPLGPQILQDFGPTVSGSYGVALVLEADLDTIQGGNDLAPGLTTGTDPLDTRETATLSGVTFTAGSQAIDVTFGATSGITVTEGGNTIQVFWVASPDGTHLDGYLVDPATHQGAKPAIELQLTDPVTHSNHVDANGTINPVVTVTLTDAFPHDASGHDTIIINGVPVVATDSVAASDGTRQTATTTLEIDIVDDTPVSTGNQTATPTLDDDAFAHGNFGGTGDVTDAHEASGGPGSLFNAGADGVKSITLDSATTFKAIFVDGHGIAHQEDVTHDAGVVGIDGSTVWTFTANDIGTVATLTIGADGSYDFKTDAPLVHPTPGATEENLPLTFGYTVTDGDNDTASGSLTVNVNDDTPVATSTQSVTYHADEGDIVTLRSVGTSPDDGNADGSYTGWPTADIGVGPAVVSGTVATAVNFGADGEGGFSFASNTISTLQNLGLTSNGGTLSYQFVGDTLVAYVNNAIGGYQPVVDRLVFTMTLDHTSGEFVFSLNDQLDHVAPPAGTADTNTDLQGSHGVVSGLDFGSLIVATDGDGDSITLDGKLTIDVTDDIPKIISFDVTGKTVVIDETAGKQGNDTTSGTIVHQFDGVSHVGSDPDMAPQYASNSKAIVSGLYASGADDSAHAVLSLQISANGTDSGLTTTDGHHIYLFNESGIIVGRIDGDGGGVVAGGSAADVAAFAVSIDQSGHISVAQYLSIHNGDATNPNDTMTLGSTISAQIAVTDHDGDTVTQSVAIGNDIQFNDDGPTLLSSGSVTYHADEGDIAVPFVSIGTSPNDGNADGSFTGSPTDNILGPAVVSGSVLGAVNFGADGEGGFSFASNTVSTLQNLGLTSNGGTLSYAIVGDTVVAYVNNAFGGYQPIIDRTVFTLSLDHTTGDFQFKLYDQLDHVAPAAGTADQNTDLQGSHGAVSGLDFGSLIVATDGDGDSVTLNGKLTIDITDDIPKITSFFETGATVTIDETAGKQSNDTTSSSIAHQFDDVAHVGHDPDMGNAPQYAFNLAPVVLGSFVSGADDSAHAVLSLQISANGADSGLTTTDGHHIYLFNEGGVIVGRIDGDGGGVVAGGSAADVAAFAVSIDQSGHISVAQYLSIHNGDATNPNDTMTLGSTISAQIAVTDHDGDAVTQSVAVGSDIHFNDDGPKVISNASVSASVDEDGLSWANQDTNPTLPGEVTGTDSAVATSAVFGNLATLINFGADGLGSFGFKTVDTPQATGLTSEHQAISIEVVGGILIGFTGSDPSQNQVFTLTLGTDGSYTFNLLKEMDHPTLDGHNGDNTENSLSIDLSGYITATDGDGDSVNLGAGSFTVNVLDDIPVITARDAGGTTTTTTTIETFTEHFDIKAGNVTALGLGVTGDQSSHNLLLTAPGSTVNTNSDDIGVGNQWIDNSSEVLNLNFVTGLQANNSYSGVDPHSSVSFTVGVVGNKDAVVFIDATSSGSFVALNFEVNGQSTTHVHEVFQGGNPIGYVLDGVDSASVITVNAATSGDTFDVLKVSNYDGVQYDGTHSFSGDKFHISGVETTVMVPVVHTVTTPTETFTVSEDESAGLNTAADPNPANDVAAPASGTDAYNVLYHAGAIGYAESAESILVNDSANNFTAMFTGNAGADQPGTYSFAVTDANGNAFAGTDSGLTTLDHTHILLTTAADGSLVGSANGTEVFKVYVDHDGHVWIAQYQPINNPVAGSDAAAFDDIATVTADLHIKGTLTDSDGDSVSAVSGVSLQVQFQDDGPSLTVSTPDTLSHSLFFDGFTLNGDVWGVGSGIDATGVSGGWTIATSGTGGDGSGTVQLERVGDGYQGMHSSTHGFMVDLDASARDVKLTQPVGGLTTGESYVLTFEAGAPFPNSAHLEVWFGGQKVFDLNPTGSMQTYSLELFGGSGDGSNTLEFRETGTPDNQGTYIANVHMNDVIVIDETAGHDADSNETSDPAIAALFHNITITDAGHDANFGAPQYATGSSAAVNYVANFGTDGPQGGSAAAATSYSLVVSNANSGLITTDNHAIQLSLESGIVVGRYDSDGNGSLDSVALAFTIDPHTGVMSVVQYVSLQHPDHTSSDEGVYLNADSLSAQVTIVDGDGDHVTQSADISNEIRFEDDGPVASNYAGNNFAEGSGAHDIGVAATLLQIHAGADGLQGVTFSAGDHGGSLSIDNNGHLIYTSPADVLSATTVTETFSYTVTDGDGDTVTKQITFGVTDTGVGVVSASSAVVDEDDIPVIGNNDHAAGDDATNNVGHISYTLGADSVQSVILSANTAGLTKLDGTAIHTTWDTNSHTLIGYGGNDVTDVVFTIAVTGMTNTGADYQVTLVQPVQHPSHTDPSNPASTSFEDNKDVAVTATVTDSDGSQNTANFTVSIDDDSPVIIAPQAGTTSEADLASSATAHGSLDIHFGADGPSGPGAPASGGVQNTINFDDAHNGTLPGNTYSHDGFTFHTDQGIANITDHAGQIYGTAIDVSNGGQPFTITQMDLGLFGTSTGVPADNVRLTGVDATTGQTITMLFNVGTTISLGDSATTFHAAGTVFDGVSLSSLKIESIAGWQGSYIFNGSVVVDNVVLGSGSAPLTHGDVSFTDLTTAINNIAIVDDQNHAVSAATLTSHGDTIHYVLLDAMTLVGYTGDTAPTAVDGGNVVFSVVLSQDANNPNGAYDFTLKQPLDDLPSSVTDLKLTFDFTAKDGDGDATSGHFTVNVHDDVPHPVVAATGVTLTIDETAGDQSGSGDILGTDNTPIPAALAGVVSSYGAPIEIAHSDGAVISSSGSYGADGQGSTPVAPAYALLVAPGGVDSGLTATDGNKIFLYEESGLVIGRESTGANGDPAGAIAFAISLDSASGVATIAEYTAIHHPDQTDPNDSVSMTNGALQATVTFTDGDGDHVTSAPVSIGGQINFLDDGPTIITLPQNLIVNGSFEQGHTDLGNGQWSIYNAIDGWTAGSDHVPFEIQTSGAGGVAPQDQNAIVELDSDPTSGNLPAGPDHQNTTGHTDATIQQTITTQAGQTYELTFWYAARPGATDGDSSGMNVLWNGATVQEIHSTGLTAGDWQQYSVLVTGTGSDVVGFQGTGPQDSLGALLDNVSLAPVTIVDEDGLKVANGDFVTGNNDSQPGDAIVPDTDHVAPATGGDHNEATATGYLNINWGADNFDAADTYTDANGFTQDHSGRSLTFTNNSVGIVGAADSTGATLTSHGDAISFSLSQDGTTLIGTATHDGVGRTVLEVTLSDDGKGAFHVALHDALDQSAGGNENDIVLTFNYTATDSDGDHVAGTFSVAVDDDVPVAKADTDTVSTTGAHTLTFDDITLTDGQEQPLPANYDTFNITQGGVYNPGGGTYATHSGENLAFIGEKNGINQDGYTGNPGDPITIRHVDGTNFTALSAWFSSNASEPLNITITAYDDNNNVIGTQISSIHTSTNGGPTYVDLSGLGSADHLTIQSPDGAYFGFDDFSYIDNATATGNVITGADTTSGVAGADALGADGGHVTAITFGATTVSTADANGNLSVHGTYGALTINADGTYTYTRDAGSAGGHNDVFTYTLTDGDGDTSQATLTITIGDSTPTLGNIPTEGGDHAIVYEAGLAAHNGEPAGSNTGNEPVTAAGDIAFTSVDGVSAVSLGGHNLLMTPTVFTDASGSMSAYYTYDPATGAGTIHYSYTLTDNTLVDPSTTSFAVIVTDGDNETTGAATNLVIDIIDDAPVAHVDTNSINENTTLHSDATTNVLHNDISGADGFAANAVVGVQFGNDASNPVSGDVGQIVHGTYGDLTLNADGSYTYVAHSVGANVSDTFVYTVADGDGDLSTTTLTIDVNDVGQPLAISGAITGTVYEDALLNANIDVGTTPTAEVSGNLANELSYTGDEGGLAGLSFSFTSLGSGQQQVHTTDSGHPLLTSGGHAVFFYQQDATTLIGYTDNDSSGTHNNGDTTVFTLTLNQSTGAYDFTLNAPIDQPVNPTEDTLAIDLGGRVQVTDTTGVNDTQPIQNFTINVVDDIPVAAAHAATVNEGSGGTNLILMIDTSGSVGDNQNAILTQEKAAAINLLNSGADIGQVLVVNFASDAHASGWLSAADAKTYINNLVSGGNTNYDAALQTTMDYIHSHATPVAGQTIGYFLSDGAPTSGDTIGSSDQATWESFLTSQNISVYGVKFGSTTADSDIAPIAFPNDGNVHNVGIGSGTTLPSYTAIAPHTVNGNVLTGEHFGADGAGNGSGLQSVTIGGTVYTFDNSAGHITYNDGTAHTINGSTLDVHTSLGELVFNFATGDYSYTTAASVSSDQTETFHFTIVDKDGDAAGADLNITIHDIPNLPPHVALNETGPSGTISDDFASGGYSGGTGWGSGNNWVEENDGSGNVAGSGNIRVSSETLTFRQGTDEDDAISRHVDLSGKSSATVSFDYTVTSHHSDDITVQAWNNVTNSWENIGTIDGSSNTSSGHFSQSLSTDQIGANSGIRFVAADDFGGSQSITIDNVAINYTTITASDSHTASFTEDGTAVAIAAASLVTDNDDSLMSSAKVVLTNEHTGDYLAINGTQLHDGSTGTVNGIGYTVSDTGSAITVNLTGNDGLSDYQTAINAITYGSNSQDPSEVNRTVDVTVTDAHGNISNTAETTIAVHAVNDAPTLTAASNNATFTEGNGVGVQGDAVFVFKNAAVDTVESGQTIKELDLTVSGLKDGANETINVDGSTISLVSNSFGTTATDGMTYLVMVSGGVATVTLKSAAGISEAAAQALVNGIQYQNTNVDNPTDGNRTFTLTSIIDNGGTDNGGHDTTSLSINATVNVNPIDDPTVITNGLHIISNNGSDAFTVSDAAFLNYVTDADGTLTITDATNDNGLTASHSGSAITIDDNSTPGGTFTFVVSDGTPPSVTSGAVTYQQDTNDSIIDGTNGNDIIVAAANSTVQHTTIAFNAGGYDIGDKVSLTVNGTTYNYTVDSSHTSAEAVYDGLRALVGTALSGDGVTWASNLDANHSVTLTGDPGETFTVTSGITNAAAKPWITTVDFDNSVSNFSSGSTEHISITVNGVAYSEGYTSGSTDNTRFDDAAGHLVDTLNGVSGVTASYNTSQNTFTITTTFDPHTVTGSSTSNDTSGSVSALQTGTAPTDQTAPLTATTYDNLTLNGNGGDDYLIGSNGSDTLYGGSGHDVMVGGNGADHFLYSALTDGGNLASGDHILDFSGSSAGGQGDVIDLLASVFGGGSGAIANADLIQVGAGLDLTAASGASAVNMGSAHFAYQQSTGQLFYDGDGGGAANRVLVAVFDNHAVVQATDIHKV